MADELEALILPGLVVGGIAAVILFKDQIIEAIGGLGDLIPSGDGNGGGDGGGGGGNGGDGGGGGGGSRPKCAPGKVTCKDGKCNTQAECNRQGNCKTGTHWDGPKQQCIPNHGGSSSGGGGGNGDPTPPPVPTGAKDANGIMIPYKMTGRKVKLNNGARHENGDRYNANHSFKNYYVVAYYKTSSGQELLEMKTDGPNHSGCSSLPKCMWAEPAFELKGGKSHISSEYPHPTNHDAVSKGFTLKTIPGNWGGKTIGYGVAAYNNSAGYRVYDQWIDTGGLVGGRPANKWVRTIHGANTGQLMPNPKRSLPTSGRGLEAEIRCHGGHGTSMSMGNIYEIQQPSSSSNLAYAYFGTEFDRITIA